MLLVPICDDHGDYDCDGCLFGRTAHSFGRSACRSFYLQRVRFCDLPHDKAVSVSLPSWRANIGYEEGEEWVLSKMMTGYPRYFGNAWRNKNNHH